MIDIVDRYSSDGQFVGGHFQMIADVDAIADQDRHVPGFAFDGLNASQLADIRSGVASTSANSPASPNTSNQVAAEQHLSVAELAAAVLPFQLAVGQVEADQDAFVDAVEVSFVAIGLA